MKGIKATASQMTRMLRKAVGAAEVDPGQLERALAKAAEQQPAPVLWLLGTTQSGKSSIVRTLTGQEVEIGSGFQPCTRTASLYEFPADAPVISFLDTRGLGETQYDPAEDIAYCEVRSHLVIAVVRVTEPFPGPLFGVLRKVRKRHPKWPVIIAQTRLHEAYEGDIDHPDPYPFDGPDWEKRTPEHLRRLILSQRQEFESLPGSGDVVWVPIDFTLPEDGFNPPDYGSDALWTAIEHASFGVIRTCVISDPQVDDVFSQAAHPRIVGYSLAAASVGAVPVVDIGLVPTVQAGMLRALAETYRLKWTVRSTSEFLGLLGTMFAAGYGLRLVGRSVIKLIPVWGQTVGAVWGASARFMVTFALGKAACAYLSYRRDGETVDAAELRAAYREALNKGKALVPGRRNKVEK